MKAKDSELVSEKTAHSKVESERQALLVEIARVQQGIAASSQENAATQKELDNMCTAISLAGQVQSLYFASSKRPFNRIARFKTISKLFGSVRS